MQNEPGRHGGRPSNGENNLFLRFSGGSGSVPTVLAMDFILFRSSWFLKGSQ